MKLQGQRRLGGHEKGQSHIFSRMAFSITNPQVENIAFQRIYDQMLFAKLMMQFLEVAMQVSRRPLLQLPLGIIGQG